MNVKRRKPGAFVPRLVRLAPWVSLAVLMGFSQTLPTRVDIDDRAVQRRQLIADALNDVPYFIGDWIGRDEEVPPEAQKLLRPNAIFSRTYQKPGGLRLQLLMVHCSDARDMIGHYPPICYPSSGWVNHSEPTEQTVLQTQDHELPVRLYRFRRMRDRGHEDRILIFSAFVLPGGTVTGDISDINRQSQRLAISAQGVAQLQVIAPESISLDEAQRAADDLLSGLGNLFTALQVAEGDSSDT